MYYEEKFENGVWYSRSTPDGAWSKKMRQMSKEDEPKLVNPIASHETDVPRYDPRLNQELLDALKTAKVIIGHPDDDFSRYISGLIERAEQKGGV